VTEESTTKIDEKLIADKVVVAEEAIATVEENKDQKGLSAELKLATLSTKAR
jgi:hypothetical protein